jgi:hypothetical protein
MPHSLSDLLAWFTANGGTIDRSALTFAQIEGLGWGAFALRDLQVQPFAHHLHHHQHHLFFIFLLFVRFCLLKTR